MLVSASGGGTMRMPVFRLNEPILTRVGRSYVCIAHLLSRKSEHVDDQDWSTPASGQFCCVISLYWRMLVPGAPVFRSKEPIFTRRDVCRFALHISLQHDVKTSTTGRPVFCLLPVDSAYAIPEWCPPPALAYPDHRVTACQCAPHVSSSSMLIDSI